MEFKVGDKVKIEGILTRTSRISNFSTIYELSLLVNDTYIRFTKDGRYLENLNPFLELVERPKVKVKKYRILYEFNGRLFVTQDYYKDLNDFKNIIKADMVLQLLESTEKEFEE